MSMLTKLKFQKPQDFFLKMLLVFLFSANPILSFADETWQSLGKGIAYLDLNASLLKPWSHIHVFRIDPEQYQFQLLSAKSKAKRNTSVHEAAYKENALLAINGGFFDNDYRPLGLRISQYRQINPLKRISWWGIFYIQNNRPSIKSVKYFKPSRQINFAIQSGPRLIIDNQIPSLKPGIAERSALGITKDNQIIVLATENHALSTSELAEIMKEAPLSCTDALNLDGGKSTQLYANIENLKLSVRGYSYVSDVVLVKAQRK